MTEPKQFKRGHRTYTKMGSFREVRIEGKAPAETPPPPAMTIDPATETGVYSNQTSVFGSADEVVVDFGFVSQQIPKGRVRSRVVMSHKHARELAKLLKKATENEK